MKIPEDRIPYKVTVNGVTTVLESGAELTVSASVQDAIEATEDFPADPLPVDKPWECGYPAPKSGDTGKVLTVGEDGKPGWYEASGGTTVVANPTLAGTEADLTGLQVGDTKYKVPAGGGGGVLVVDSTSTTLDKTWKEIHDASTTSLVISNNGYGVLQYLCYCAGQEDFYRVQFFGPDGMGGFNFIMYATSSENGYPVAQG